MAERRMFAKTVIDSDAFLDMPLSTQALYFHLSMRADDDGFINNPKKIQRMVGASDDDLKVLAAKNFIIPFDTGVVVIKHWKIHNYIRGDRKHSTKYLDELSMLSTKENGAYTISPGGYLLDDGQMSGRCQSDVSQVSDTCQSSDGQMSGNWYTEVRLGKDSINKQSNKLDCSSHLAVEQSAKKHQTIVDEWNSLTDVGIKPIRGITEGSQRDNWLKTRIRQYGEDAVIDAIKEIRDSSFLQGNNRQGWMITFDWFIRPNNFPKVLEGNYRDKSTGDGHGEQITLMDDLQ